MDDDFFDDDSDSGDDSSDDSSGSGVSGALSTLGGVAGTAGSLYSTIESDLGLGTANPAATTNASTYLLIGAAVLVVVLLA